MRSLVITRINEVQKTGFAGPILWMKCDVPKRKWDVWLAFSIGLRPVKEAFGRLLGFPVVNRERSDPVDSAILRPGLGEAPPSEAI